MNVLIVEDDKIIAEVLKNILKKVKNINLIQSALTFNDAYQKAMSQVFDIVLIDIFLDKNDFNGIDLCKSIRKVNSEIILIFITSAISLKYLEEAFLYGANDYITKPFNYKEVELRIKRWSLIYRTIKTSQIISYYELSYDTMQNEFYLQKNQIKLTKKEKRLLSIFLRKKEETLTQEYLQEKLWGDFDLTFKTRNIRSNIQLLKKALPDKCKNWIQNIRGEGYILKK